MKFKKKKKEYKNKFLIKHNLKTKIDSKQLELSERERQRKKKIEREEECASTHTQ